MDVKAQPVRPVDWREAWRPAFDRLLASIEIAAKLTRPQLCRPSGDASARRQQKGPGFELAARGQMLARHVNRWRRERDAIHRYVETACWSERRGSYTFYAGTDELDASLAVATRLGYPAGKGRLQSTLSAIRSELGPGPHLYRYSGQASQENCFVACGFWEAEALARLGRCDDAATLIDALVPCASDVGILSEQIDPGSGELLGNTPQALSHLALINAAYATAGG